jgi:hypothetical protein
MRVTAPLPIVLLCALALAPPHAGAAFTPPKTLASSDAYDPEVAMDPDDGTAFVVWGTGRPSLKAQVIEPSGRAGPTLTLAKSRGRRIVGWSGPDAGVAVDARGRATVAWTDWRYPKGPRVRARRIDEDSDLGPVRDLARIEHEDPRHYPQVAVDPRGRAIVAWDDRGGVHATRLAPSGGPGPVIAVSRGILTYGGFTEFDLAIDPRGRATVVWKVRKQVLSRQVDASGRLGAVQSLGFGHISSSAVAVDPLGRATVTWQDSRGAIHPLQGVILARQLDPAGNPGPERVLAERSDDPNTYMSLPNAGVDDSGTATIAWQRHKICCPAAHSLEALRLGAGAEPGPTGTVFELSPYRSVAFDLAVSPNGRSTMAWRDSAIRATHLDPAGIPGATETLSGPAKNAVPDVAVDADGRAAVVWNADRGNRSSVLFSSG